MNRLLSRLTLTITITVGILLYSTPIASQLTPSAKKAARVQITQGPDIERADHDSVMGDNRTSSVTTIRIPHRIDSPNLLLSDGWLPHSRCYRRE